MLVEEMQEAVEGVIEDIHQMQDPEHLPSGMEESIYYGQPKLRSVCSAPLLGTMKRNIGSNITTPLRSSKQTSPKNSTSIPSSIDNISGNSPSPTTLASDSEYEHVPSIHSSQFCEPDEGEGREDDRVTENQTLLGNNNPLCDLDELHNPEGDSLLPLSNGATSPERIECPTLALAQSQFEMIQNLDTMGFYKFPVWIHNDTHSHAAIIVRRPWKKSWAEGKVVVRHWVEEMFVA